MQQPPSELPYRTTIGRASSRNRVLVQYIYEFRSRPSWLLLVVGTSVLSGLAVAMLAAGGPIPWPWCIVWLLGCLWAVVPFAIQLGRNIQTAQRRDRPGDVLEGGFDGQAMWVRNGERFRRFAFTDYVLGGTISGFAVLKPCNSGRVVAVLPSVLFQDSEQIPPYYFAPMKRDRAEA